MSKYIDAEKLIERLEEMKRAEYENCGGVNSKTGALQEVQELIDSLQQEQPSLPSNIDEAAEKWKEEHFRREYYQVPKDAMSRSFKAGAEWMARQGVTLNLSIDELSCGAYNSCVEQGLTSEDDVIIQVRKKQ